MTVEYRRMDGRGRKKSPERRCKAPSRDEVVPGHLRAEHRNRSGPSARRPSPSGPPPTRRGTDHFTRGARLALSPGTSVGSWAAVVAGGSLRAPPQPLARHSRRGTRPGKLTSEACLTVKYRRTDGRRQKRSPEPRCKTPPRDEAVPGHPCAERRNRLWTIRPPSLAHHRHDAVSITLPAVAPPIIPRHQPRSRANFVAGESIRRSLSSPAVNPLIHNS